MNRENSIHYVKRLDSNFSKIIKKYKSRRIVVFLDHNVNKYYIKKIQSVIIGNQNNITYKILALNENSKNLNSIKKIIDFFIKYQIDKETIIFSAGGGVLGDLIGFACSVYMRGLKHVSIPTTLLSQIDSSIGGKTGVNYERYKNLIGSFYEPCDVIICSEFLKSLSSKEYLNGFGEVAKYGLLDGYLFSFLINNRKQIIARDSEIINELIKECVKIKLKIVKKDFKDSNSRRFLNLGHTFAHAIESMSFNKITHGIAVSFGLRIALSISSDLYNFPKEKINSLNFILKSIGFSETLDIAIKKDRLMKYIKLDKKKEGKKNNYILLRDVGKPCIENDVDDIYIENALNKINKKLLH